MNRTLYLLLIAVCLGGVALPRLINTISYQIFSISVIPGFELSFALKTFAYVGTLSFAISEIKSKLIRKIAWYIMYFNIIVWIISVQHWPLVNQAFIISLSLIIIATSYNLISFRKFNWANTFGVFYIMVYLFKVIFHGANEIVWWSDLIVGSLLFFIVSGELILYFYSYAAKGD